MTVFSQAQNFILFRELKTSGTDGGTFTLGAWRRRALNEETSDDGEHASLAGEQITLDAGTYICKISAPATQVDRHRIRLQNITAGTTIAYGTSEQSWATDGTQTRSFLTAKFSIGASKVLEVQHRSSATKATVGFGYASGLAEEVYTVAEFWKVG